MKIIFYTFINKTEKTFQSKPPDRKDYNWEISIIFIDIKNKDEIFQKISKKSEKIWKENFEIGKSRKYPENFF